MARTAELRFGHPYAVVAVARPGTTATAARPWSALARLPVFSAWVAKADEAVA